MLACCFLSNFCIHLLRSCAKARSQAPWRSGSALSGWVVQQKGCALRLSGKALHLHHLPALEISHQQSAQSVYVSHLSNRLRFLQKDDDGNAGHWFPLQESPYRNLRLYLILMRLKILKKMNTHKATPNFKF